MKKKFVKLILVYSTVFLLSLSTVFAASINVFPSKDARVEEGNLTRNFGDSKILAVRSFLDDDKRTFIKFDLPTLPSNANIVSAILKLFVFDAPGKNRIYELHKISTDWVEGDGGTDDTPMGEITANNQPATNLTASSSTGSGTVSDVNISFDVTDDVRGFYSGEFTNNGWRIKDSVEDKEEAPGRESLFRSRENISQQPVLEINYVSCGIDLDTASISFGSVFPGSESLQETISVTNTGTDLVDVFVIGSEWTIDSSTLPASRTVFSSEDVSEIELDTNPQIILDDLQPEILADTFWQFKAEVNDPSGNYSQTITLTSSC
jgi:hypothetical protein